MEWVNFFLCRRPRPFKPQMTFCGLIRFCWWSFVTLPVLRAWYTFRYRCYIDKKGR